MPKSIKELADERAKLHAENTALLDLADAEKRTLNTEEEAAYAKRDAELDAIGDEIDKLTAHETRRQRSASLANELTRPLPRQVTPSEPGLKPTVPAVARDREAESRFGFDNLASFAMEVHRAGITKTPTQRLTSAYTQYLAAQGMGEAIGADGGFQVPPQFASKIFERVYAPDSLLSRTDIYTVGGNSITFPRNLESSRATGSRWGGVQSYWIGEGSTITASKPTFGQLTLKLNKMAALGVMTEELLADSGSAMDQYLVRCFGGEINFRIGDALINGTGAGQPLGVLNADCTVSVTKETGQSAATISATNILKMWSRLFAGCRSNAVWLINQDVEPQLHTMQIGTGVANQVVYMPPGGLSSAPYATLLGRPVLPVEYCATLGTVGDIILTDLSQWATAVKSGGPQSAVSMHLYFNTDEQAFRVTYRIDSQPWWASALTPYKGSNTQSCAVTLATRA